MNNLLTSKQAEAYNRGFNVGSKQQREADIKYLISLLENIEDIYGIGKKTASKIQNHVLEKFEEK